jgi:hypothetical protein
MATETVDQIYDTGEYLYYRVVRESDGKVLDFADNTFKTLATTSTMHVQMSSVASVGGGESLYAASLDLADINETMTPVAVKVVKYLRAGGSIVLADDEHLSAAPIVVVNGSIQGEDGVQAYYVDPTWTYTTENGVSQHFTAELKSRDGKSILLADIDPAATLTINVTRDADATEGERVLLVDLDDTDCGSVNSDSIFEVEYNMPLDAELAALYGYRAKFYLTTGGVTYEGDCKPSA